MGSQSHMQLSVRGALMTWVEEEWVGVCRGDTGKPMSPMEVKAELLDHLSRGHEVIPIGGPCEGFDYSGGGCPGHDTA